MKAMEQLIAAIDKNPLSDRQLSLAISGSTDTIRNIRRGSSPRLKTVESVCNALGLRLYIGPSDQPGQAPVREREYIDRERLQAAVEAVEEGLRVSQRVLEDKKKGELVLAAYDFLAEDDTNEQSLTERGGRVTNIVKLIA